MSNFVVPDSVGGLVWTSSPYSKFFLLTGLVVPSGTAYLILTVKTGYTDPSESALVVINGTAIGTIDPRPWTNHFAIDLETMIFVFDNSVLSGFPFGPVNNLQIVLQGNLADPYNYLLLGDAICHYQ